MKAAKIFSYTLFVIGATLFAYTYLIGLKPIPQHIGCKLTDCYVEKKNCDMAQDES